MTLRDLLLEHRIPFAPAGHHHITPGRIQVDCPLCSPNQRRWRLGIHESGRYLHCWSCGRVPAANTLAELLNIPIGDVIRVLDAIIPQKRPETQSRGKLTLPDGLCNLKGVHKDYLQARGFNPDEIASLWGVQGIGIASRLTWRLFIPIQLGKKTVSWTTRALTDKSSAKYVSAKPEEESVSLKSVLYGEDMLQHAAIIVEGPADAWRVGPGAVATLGATFTTAQIVRLIKYPIRVVCYDNDTTGRKKAKELTALLSPYPGETYNVCLETGKDPASASEKEVQKLRTQFLS